MPDNGERQTVFGLPANVIDMIQKIAPRKLQLPRSRILELHYRQGQIGRGEATVQGGKD
jgi:hypothetical protein